MPVCYEYDAAGNRIKKTEGERSARYHYNAKNQLIYEENAGGIKSFTYDRQGGIVEEKGQAGTRRFTYNSRHQQTRVETEPGNVQENRYDSEGLRYELLENGRRTSFVYHNGELLYEKGGETGLSREKTSYHLGAGIEALHIGQKAFYFHKDEQLSTLLILDEKGDLKNQYQYDAFGAGLEALEEFPNRIRYTGQQYDKLTEQYYLRARYYNSVLGRFMQEDVYQRDGLNLYAYCRNNPIVYSDSSGYGRKKDIWKNINYCGSSSDFCDENSDNYLDDESPKIIRVGKQNGDTPRNNSDQNEQFNEVFRRLGIEDKDKQTQFHQFISHRGYGFEELMKKAREFFESKVNEMTVYEFLDNLVMLPVRVIGRASNMLWIGIGEEVKLMDVKGKEQEVSTYALHIQCRWRIVNKERREILLAASDFYSPKADIDDYSNFDWEPQGNNLFDEKSQKWLIRESPIYINKYKINMWGDLFLTFTNNDRLEIFITSTGDTEGWRIFECGKEKPHLVARGMGINFEI